MSAPASEDLRELERMLVIAGETGEPRPFAELREELAFGHEAMVDALDVLRQHGKAEEVAPGLWSSMEGAPPAPAAKGPVLVSVSEPERQTMADVLDGSDAEVSRGPLAYGEVRLTMGIASSLSAEVLGQLVKSGIDEAAAAGGGFVLEVTP